jgi:hypothetical protein
MNKLAKITVVVVVFGIFAIALDQFRPGTSEAGGAAPVMVTNTPLPVDVGSPNVKVTNVPTVNLNGVPGVLVANSIAQAVPVRDLDNPDPALHPFQTNLCETTNQSLYPCTLSNTFTVDSTIRGFVIEYVSASCENNSTNGRTNDYVGIHNTAGGVAAAHLVVQFGREVIGSTFTNITFGQQTRIYADPGSAVRLSFSPGSIDGRCEATLSGHEIP